MCVTRSYTLGKRAERQAETRRRIVEAAVALHGEVGPAATTVKTLAERAGVQRHTVYAHFPDERSLQLACSGLAMERDPFPDALCWSGIENSGERLRAGLGAVYAWFGRNSALIGCVLRDAEHQEVTREVSELRLGPPIARCREVLGAGLGERQRVTLEVALSFFTWRTLVRDLGLSEENAVDTMARAVEALA